MYFKGRGDKEGSRSGEASGSSGAFRGRPIKQIENKIKKVVGNKGQWSWSEFPRQLRGNSRNAPELLPDRSEKAPGQLPEIPQKGPPAAQKRFPKSCRPASREIRQNSWATLGQLRFPLFNNTFPICLIFSITVGARISPKSSGLAR